MEPFTIVNGNAIDFLDTFEYDAVVMDPPYGIKWEGYKNSTVQWTGMQNDDGSLDLTPFLCHDGTVVSFGPDHYSEQVPPGGRWHVWDKRGGNVNADRMRGAPFELIWSNVVKGGSRFYRIMHGGAVNADGWGVKRVHPTQKPIILMERLIEDFTKPGDVVIDPFMGSGTTGVACANTGRGFIGIELDRAHYDIAKSRISQVYDGRLAER